MARLIDADKFRAFLDRQYHNCHGYSGNKKELYREALRAVKSYVHSEGQIDAVPVVRCKDCVHHEDEEPGMVYCPAVIGGWVSNNFFCGDGEREKNERNN